MARWAPSPHNTQPWRIEVRSEREADLFAERGRLLPVEDPEGRFPEAGFGVFAEALRDRRGRARSAPAVRGAVPGPRRTGPTSNRSLPPSRSRTTRPVLPRLLAARRTSRLPSDGRPAPPDALRRLRAGRGRAGPRMGLQPGAGARRLGRRPERRHRLLRPSTRSVCRAEIGRWTHTTNAAADAPATVPRRAASASGPRRQRLLSSPLALPAMRCCARSAVRSTCGRRGAPRPLRGLSGPWRTPQDWFTGGRMLLRLWLTATEHGLQLHPFGSVITSNRTAHARLAE